MEPKLSRVEEAIRCLMLLPATEVRKTEVHPYWGRSPVDMAKLLDYGMITTFGELWEAVQKGDRVRAFVHGFDTVFPVYDPAVHTLAGKTVIGFAAPAQGGKDTAVRCFIDTIGGAQVFFAQGLKQMCQILFDLTEEETWSNDLAIKEAPIARFLPYGEWSPRRIFQLFGTEVVRNNISENAWPMRVTLLLSLNADKVQYISDVRFPNEQTYMYDLEDKMGAKRGVLVHIQCPHTKRISTGVGHLSEAGLPVNPRDLTAVNPFKAEYIGHPVLCANALVKYKANLYALLPEIFGAEAFSPWKVRGLVAKAWLTAGYTVVKEVF